jgi:mRNA interferase MazF
MRQRRQRGEVWRARLDEERPVVILSETEAGQIHTMIIVPAAATDIEGIAVEVRIGSDEGLPWEGVLRVALPHQGRILCNWLVDVAPTDLIERVGVLSSGKMRQLEDALRLGELE